MTNHKANGKETGLRAATLAVGTELTDGQILDRNSAWISQELTRAGIQVIEHRAVADDTGDIARALRELSSRVDLLFVTGGLGPTSDDFTRDLIAEVFSRPLEFNEESWQHIQAQLGARGIVAREIQKQQCFFPRGARVLKNTAGTANAFAFTTDQGLRVYTLPGPPVEIAAVWVMHLHSEIEALVPLPARERLHIIRCLGLGESSVAEIVEAQILGSDCRVGYRAHMPYVEVKLWYVQSQSASATATISKVDSALRKWVVNHDDEDVADPLLAACEQRVIEIRDEVSRGVLADRLFQRVRHRGKATRLTMTTVMDATQEYDAEVALPTGIDLRITLQADRGAGSETPERWAVLIRGSSGFYAKQIVTPIFNYKLDSERGRKFIAEKALIVVGAWLNESQTP